MIPFSDHGSPALGFLHELAVDPPRALRRAPTIGLREVLYPASCTRLRARGWREVERQIPEAIRDELALLLVQASQMTFAVPGRVFLDPRDARGRSRAVQPAKWRSDASAVVHEEEEAADDPFAAAKALLRMVLQGSERRPSSLDLAVASLRLVPDDRTRLMVSLRESAIGHSERSVELIQSVLHSCDQGILAAYAWNRMAAVLYSMARYLDAIDAARRATYVMPTLPRGPLNWLIAAIQAGEDKEVRLASRFANDHIDENNQELAQITALLRIERANNLWSPTLQSRRASEEAAKQGPIAKRISDEFV